MRVPSALMRGSEPMRLKLDLEPLHRFRGRMDDAAACLIVAESFGDFAFGIVDDVAARPQLIAVQPRQDADHDHIAETPMVNVFLP
jgi:hypothetical protein